MRRVVSLFLPTLATDRLGASTAPSVTRLHDGHRMVVAAANAPATALGLRPGLPLAEAQARIPDLTIHEADLDGDAAALARLAAWCLRLSPLTAPDTDGIWIDATGCAHLQGGETAMLDRLLARLAADGITARAALADTPGAAHGLARYAAARRVIVPPGRSVTAIAALPIAALRLDPAIVAALRHLGFDTIGALEATPRAPLARRFGARLMQRLDQAAGRIAEPITPVIPPDIPSHRLAFAEPLLTADSIAAVITNLVHTLCAGLERSGQGARQLDLLFERIDGTIQAIRIGTARPTRDPRHLARLLDEQIETIDPGLGVEAMHLLVPLADPLAYTQTAALTADPAPDITALIDRLANRLGASRVWRAMPVESDVPERSVRRIAPLAASGAQDWPAWPRPTRLLTPPQPVEALAMLPDHSPARFTWRRRHYLIRRADGPERIAGEWWRREGETTALRDYWHVEDETGRRFWLYRRGDGADPDTGDLQWFVHGVF